MQQAKTTLTQRCLLKIETWGNALPHPTMLFIYLSLLVLALSWLGEYWALVATHPVSGEAVKVVNLLSVAGLEQMLSKMVTNFIQFAPVGPVLVAMLGLGIAERSGLIRTALKLLVLQAPAKLLTFIVVLAGVLSSIAVDSGYVVMIPMAGLVFLAAGRHPLAGIAACFAGVSGGFSANLLIGPVDVILGGISTEAAHLLDADYEVTATANYYFIIASTLLIAGLATWVTERYICPLLGEYKGAETSDMDAALLPAERKGLWVASLAGLLIVAFVLWGLIPEQGFLRHPETGGIIKSPFMSGLIALIAISAGIMGSLYGWLSGRFKSHVDVIESMEKTMALMATYIVLMFFAAQFVNYFSWTNLGLILAINGADVLQNSGLGTIPLMLGFIFFCTFANLFIGSASAKWAIMAPIFIPMFMLLGIAPEVVQAAYRVGDSSTNIITPLMPYFALVFAFMKRYDDKAGVGTMMTLMLPYSLAFLFGWGLLLSIWLALGIPLGPDGSLFVTLQ
ncbi:MAG: AbgT family transporter [Cycloclasticus sp.]